MLILATSGSSFQLNFPVSPVLITGVCLSVHSAFQAWTNVWSWLGCYICPLVWSCEFKLPRLSRQSSLWCCQQPGERFPALGLPHQVFIAPLELRVPQGQVVLLNIACNRRGKLHFRMKVSDQHSMPGRRSRVGGQVKQVIILFSQAFWWKPSLSVHCHTFTFSVTILSSLSEIKAPSLKVCCQKYLKIAVMSFIFFNIEF